MFGIRSHRDNVKITTKFLEDYTQLVNDLLNYTKDNETVSNELITLREKFAFISAPAYSRKLKPAMGNIESAYDQLQARLAQKGWDEDEVISLIQALSSKLTRFSVT